MKKLLLLIFLMTISLGYSQSFPLDFTGGADAFTGFNGNVFSIVQDEGNEVGQLASANQLFDNYQLTLSPILDLSNAGFNTITFRMKPIGDAGLTTRNHLLKFEVNTGGAASTEVGFTTVGNDWQTITLNYPAGLGSYAKLVFFTDFNNGLSGTYLVDDFEVVVDVPTCNDGIQNGSETGIDCGGTCANPCGTLVGTWRATFVGVGSARGVSEFFNLANTSGARSCFFDDEFIFNANGSFQNVQQGQTFVEAWQGGLDACGVPVAPHNGSNAATYSLTGSSLTLTGVGAHLGLPKVITNSEITSPGNAPASITYLLTTLTTTTLTVDVPLSNGAWWRFIFSNIPPVVPSCTDGIQNGTETGIDCGGSCTPCVTAPIVAAPTPPARNAWDVVSIFSGAYSNVTLNELPTVWSQLALAPFSVETIAGNATWKFGGEFLGMVTNYDNGIDLTQMTTMHIDYWTPDNKIMIAKIVNTTGPTTDGLTIVQDPVVTGTWRSVDIPMSQFGGSVNKSKITQILLDPQSGGSTVYVDNFYFYRPETTQPTPTITNFTVPSKVVGDASFQLIPPTSNSTGAFTYTVTGASGVATISGNTVTIVGGGTTTITATQAAAGSFGPGSITASFVVSFPPPTTAAPMPTVPADRVLSIFSDAYTNEGGASYPYWGQPGAYIAPAVLPIGSPSSNTLKLDNLTYQGVQLATNIDVSSMTTLHLDIWTPNCTTFDFYLIDSAPVGVPPAEQKVTVSPTQSGWNSINIPMSSYNTLALTAVQQFKFVGAPSGSVVYIDNIYFTSEASRPIAPTVANVSYCKGAVATPLTATGFGGALKWYTGTTNATTGNTTYPLTGSATAPTPSTTTSGTKKYRVSQVLSDGSESPKADITVTILTTAVPAEKVLGITSNTSGTIAGTYLAATLAVGQYVQTSTTISYRVPELIDTSLSYYWTVPAGVNIVGQTPGVRTIVQTGINANVLNVNFLNVSSGPGAVGSIAVQAQNANGCSSAAKSVALSKVLPTAPTAIKMTIGSSATAITSFAAYMGTNTVLTLTATPSTTATSYVWELPAGVNLLSGATTTSGVTSGTINVITVNFSGVNLDNTDTNTAVTTTLTKVLRIGVKSRNGVGVSTTSNTALVNPTTTSTARQLTLTAIAPAAPPKIVLTNPAFTGTAATTAITNISKYVGTNTFLTLTADASSLASSYSWELPQGVIANPASDVTTRTIQVKFSGVALATTLTRIGVKAINGVGPSFTNNSALVPSAGGSTARLLSLTSSVPAAAGTVTGQITNLCPGQTVNYTFIASALANTYTITAPTGSTVTSSSNPTNSGNVLTSSTDLNFTVTFPSVFAIVTATPAAGKTITIRSENGVGNSLTNRVLTLDTKALAAIGNPTNSYVNPITAATSATLFGKCATQIISVPRVVGATSYVWTLQNGATGTSTTNSIVVDFSLVATPTGATTNNIIRVRAQNACNSNADRSITLTWDGIAPCPDSGINKEIVPTAVAGEVSIYPNPTRDNFTLELTASQVGEMSMTIYNINGAMVRTKNVQLTEGNNVINEDVSSLSSGIYFVQIYNVSNGETVVKKLVKE